MGGFGADRLMGNAQDDILIAGTTDYDQSPAALYQVVQQWAAPNVRAAENVLRLVSSVSSPLHCLAIRLRCKQECIFEGKIASPLLRRVLGLNSKRTSKVATSRLASASHPQE